ADHPGRIDGVLVDSTHNIHVTVEVYIARSALPGAAMAIHHSIMAPAVIGVYVLATSDQVHILCLRVRKPRDDKPAEHTISYWPHLPMCISERIGLYHLFNVHMVIEQPRHPLSCSRSPRCAYCLLAVPTLPSAAGNDYSTGGYCIAN